MYFQPRQAPARWTYPRLTRYQVGGWGQQLREWEWSTQQSTGPSALIVNYAFVLVLMKAVLINVGDPAGNWSGKPSVSFSSANKTLLLLIPLQKTSENYFTNSIRESLFLGILMRHNTAPDQRSIRTPSRTMPDTTPVTQAHATQSEWTKRTVIRLGHPISGGFALMLCVYMFVGGIMYHCDMQSRGIICRAK